jgi:SEC-C motif domain protein
MLHCPCGSQLSYAACCGKLIRAQALATTPEALMRSRYTAFTKAKVDYLASTMKSPAADDFNAEETRRWVKKVRWLKLEIIHCSTTEQKGFVEFRAYFNEDGKEQILHECSEFHLIDGVWFYVNGVTPG